MLRRPRIALDLDKTLVQYDGWKGINHIGELLPGAFDFVKELSDAGWYIIIFSARAEEAKSQEIIRNWAEETFPFLPSRQMIVVTNVKLREIECFVDDRAIPFRGDYAGTMFQLEMYLGLGKPDVRKALEERKYT